MNLRQSTADALSQDLSADQLADLQKRIRQREGEVAQRIAMIRPAKGASDAGPERHRIKQTGTLDELRAIENEFTDLALESEQLAYQRQAIQTRLEVAKAKEATEALPDMLKSLDTRLAALEKAREAFSEQLQEFAAEYETVVQARVLVERSGHNAPAAKPDMVSRIARLAPIGEMLTRARLYGWKTQSSVADELGMDAAQLRRTA